MGLLDDCEEHFGKRDLYEILHVEKKVDAKQLKKAYYKQSLMWHPDRWSKENDGEDENEEDIEKHKKNATVKFQILSKVYEILSTKESRELYDETGAVGDDDMSCMSDEDFERCVAAWRGRFKKVTKEDIDAFLDEYRDSEEERGDIKAAYEKHGGDMAKILEMIYTADHDEERITGIIRDLIKAKEIKETKKFKSSAAPEKVKGRKRKAEKEAKEADHMLKQIKAKEGDGDLRALILRRQSERENAGASFLSSLEAKYGGGGSGTKKAAKNKK